MCGATIDTIDTGAHGSFSSPRITKIRFFQDARTFDSAYSGLCVESVEYAQENKDETLNGFINTYLQHDEVRQSFNELNEYKEIEEPVLHRVAINGDT